MNIHKRIVEMAKAKFTLGRWVQPKLLALIVAVIIGAPALGVSAADREPTEKEMRDAVNAKFDAVNANYRNIQQRCEAREYRNNPILGIQCLGLYGAGGGKGNLTVALTHFEKIACDKASGQAGYVCDYVVSLSSNSPGLANVLSLRNGGAGQGRFVHRDNGWLFLPIERYGV